METVETVLIPAEQKAAIARAIFEDEGSQNGEHLWDGEQLLFYCPLQAWQPPARPALRVRDLLPARLRIPTFGEYLARVRPAARAVTLPPQERAALLRAYEVETIAALARALPDQATLGRR
ncbi:MAG TPA: hypothetical protein VKV26_19250 [Dehalococcoidia bacterium]|nr:hypothetical protein [Dehalococcoidia bacterium]